MSILFIDSEKIFSKWGHTTYDSKINEIKNTEFIKMPPTLEKVRRTISKGNTDVEINLIQGNTNESLPEFIKNNPEFKADFIYIDGGHALETVENDWFYCSKFMHKNTIVLFDDYCIFPDDYKGTIWGSQVTIDNIDRTKYKVENTNEYDIFSRRKHYQTLVTLI